MWLLTINLFIAPAGTISVLKSAAHTRLQITYFEGSVTNLLSVLCFLIEIFSRAHAKGQKDLIDFKFFIVVGRFSSDGKHGSERVNESIKRLSSLPTS